MKDAVIKEIQKLSQYFNDAPYGQTFNSLGKTLPTNYCHYRNKVDDLISKLLILHDIDENLISNNEIEQICSLRDNQLMRLIVDHQPAKNVFRENGYDEKLESISSQINMIIRKFVK